MKTLDLRNTFAPLTGLDSLKRRVEERLRLSRGEWIYKPTAGLPVSDIISDERELGVISKIVTDEIETVDEVDGAEVSDSEFDADTRRYRLDVRIRSRYGPFSVSMGDIDGSS